MESLMSAKSGLNLARSKSTYLGIICCLFSNKKRRDTLLAALGISIGKAASTSLPTSPRSLYFQIYNINESVADV